jgi:hypothetical protein
MRESIQTLKRKYAQQGWRGSNSNKERDQFVQASKGKKENMHIRDGGAPIATKKGISLSKHPKAKKKICTAGMEGLQ